MRPPPYKHKYSANPLKYSRFDRSGFVNKKKGKGVKEDELNIHWWSLKQRPPIRMCPWHGRETLTTNIEQSRMGLPVGVSATGGSGMCRGWPSVSDRADKELITWHWSDVPFLCSQKPPTCTSPHLCPCGGARIPFFSLPDTRCHSVPYRPNLLQESRL